MFTWGFAIRHEIKLLSQLSNTSYQLKVLLTPSSADLTLHKKWSFPLRISLVMWPNPEFPADLVTFTEEILSGKIHFLCSVNLPGPNYVFPQLIEIKSQYVKFIINFQQRLQQFTWAKLLETIFTTGKIYFYKMGQISSFKRRQILFQNGENLCKIGHLLQISLNKFTN